MYPFKTYITQHVEKNGIFHTYAKCENKSCKITIDSGSCMNIVSTQALSRSQATLEPHPSSYKMACVNQISLSVTQKYLVPIDKSSYKDNIWCRILPMSVAHVILGRPWLYDLSDTHNKWENTYSFRHNSKKIKMYPTKSRKKSINLTRSLKRPNPWDNSTIFSHNAYLKIKGAYYH